VTLLTRFRPFATSPPAICNIRFTSTPAVKKRARVAREHLEKLGATKTRSLLTTGDLTRHLIAPAAQWSAELDEIERTRNKAFQISQMRIALSAERAARIAAFAAISAAAIATATCVLNILAWLFPSHWRLATSRRAALKQEDRLAAVSQTAKDAVVIQAAIEAALRDVR
jgi:hypothetical protein